MKRKVTITLDEHLIPQAKHLARRRGLSLSALIERALSDAAAAPGATFATRWRGGFRPAERTEEPRYQHLARKYL